MSNLQFQSFTNQNFDMSDEGAGGGYGGQIGDRGNEDSGSTTTAGPKRNFFTFAYFQQYFDVDTDQVSKRILNSAIPTHKNYITEFVQPLPDLYGPFWVCVTLVFSIGIFSNIAQYIESQGAAGNYGSDFRMVTGASSLIASYVLIVPFLISTTLWYRKAEIQYSYLEVLCAYGYSLSIFIPVSMLWVVDSNLLRWTLIFVSVALSGGVLVRTMWPAFQRDSNKMLAMGAIAAVLLLHFGLALCFKEYFFDASMPSGGRGGVDPPPPVVVPGSPTTPAVVTALNGTNGAQRPESSAILAPLGSSSTVSSEKGTEKTTVKAVETSTVGQKLLKKDGNATESAGVSTGTTGRPSVEPSLGPTKEGGKRIEESTVAKVDDNVHATNETTAIDDAKPTH